MTKRAESGERVAVVGAGVVGLSTALKLLEARPNLRVVVLGERVTPDTTSDVAAGIFYLGLQGPDKATTEKWAHYSWQHFQDLLDLARPWETGVSVLPVLHLSAYQDVTRPLMGKLCSVYRDATPRELNLALPEGRYLHGKYLHTVQIDTETYLAYLTARVQEKGGEVEVRTVESLGSLGKKFDVVINCAGLGARKLAGDPSVLPLRGQVLQVEAPWVKVALYCDDVYVIPGQHYVTVGGTRQYNDWMTEVSPHDSARIWSRATEAFPNLSGAKLLQEKVGLRPHRPTARVELEMVGELPVVHNYGHCGYGVMSSPGTAADAATLAISWVEGRKGRL